MNVDLYVGGAEHAVLHLLYSRFWHKVLYDLGLVSTAEPFKRLLNPGMIQGKSYRYFSEEGTDTPEHYTAKDVRFQDGAPIHAKTGAELKQVWVKPSEVRFEADKALAPSVDIELEEVVEKMSKSRGNVVNPDDVIAEYGADAMRLYEMFIGPLERAAPWSTEGMPGVFRFLQRTYRMFIEEDDAGDRVRTLGEGAGTENQQRLFAKTIAKVTEDYDSLSFNTAISAMMVFVRDVEKDGPLSRSMGEDFLKLLAPLAAHLAEELWQRLGHSESIAYESWPEADPSLLVEDQIELVVQVKGKVRGRVLVPADADQDAVYNLAIAEENVLRHMGEAPPRKIIFVPGRLLNIVPG